VGGLPATGGKGSKPGNGPKGRGKQKEGRSSPDRHLPKNIREIKSWCERQSKNRVLESEPPLKEGGGKKKQGQVGTDYWKGEKKALRVQIKNGSATQNGIEATER